VLRNKEEHQNTEAKLLFLLSSRRSPPLKWKAAALRGLSPDYTLQRASNPNKRRGDEPEVAHKVHLLQLFSASYQARADPLETSTSLLLHAVKRGTELGHQTARSHATQLSPAPRKSQRSAPCSEGPTRFPLQRVWLFGSLQQSSSTCSLRQS